MIYEIRTYWAYPGKAENLLRRFQNLTIGIFKKHDMELIGFWTPSPATPESGDLVYILRFPDETTMRAAWDAFRADPEWIEGHAASEKSGKNVEHITSVVLHPTDFSPLK